MKIKSVYISIVLILTLSFSCTSPNEPPSLEELLYGTYSSTEASWSANSNGNPLYVAEPTESSYLTLNPNGNYAMKLELYVEQEDTIFNIFQEGSYTTMRTSYVKFTANTRSHWTGALKFIPDGQQVWQVEFSIFQHPPTLSFHNNQRFKLPNSGGFIWVPYWMK